MDHLKSTYLTSLFGLVEIFEDPSVEIPSCAEIPPATTRDDIMEDVTVAESKAEVDEEKFDERDATNYIILLFIYDVVITWHKIL